MTAMETILSRRSIRSYTGEAITEQELQKILTAAYAAPVGMGRYDSLHITVVRSRAYLDALEAAAGRQAGREDYHPLYGAPMLIILSSVFPGIPTDNSSYSNCAILAQNMALAAAEMGIGTCHIWGSIRALNKEPALLEKLSLPEGFMPCCAITLGYTKDQHAPHEMPAERIKTTYLD